MVSLGPGDSELITLKALKALQKCDAICVPTKSDDRTFTKSLTHKIVSEIMQENSFSKPLIPIYSPMHFLKEDWQHQVDTIYETFQTHESVAFVTLGDSAVYSTVYYLLDIIKEQNKELYESCEVLAGVTSFSQASAKVKKPLCIGDSSMSIVPLLDKEVPNTTIYMRPKIGLDTSTIEDEGDIYTFENLNFTNEKITPKKIEKTTKYMTLFIDFFKRN